MPCDCAHQITYPDASIGRSPVQNLVYPTGINNLPLNNAFYDSTSLAFQLPSNPNANGYVYANGALNENPPIDEFPIEDIPVEDIPFETQEEYPTFVYITNSNKNDLLYVNMLKNGTLRWSSRPQAWFLFPQGENGEIVALQNQDTGMFMGIVSSQSPAAIQLFQDKENLFQLAVIDKDDTNLFLSQALVFTKNDPPGEFLINACTENCELQHLKQVNQYLQSQVDLCNNNKSKKNKQNQCIVC